MQKTLFLLGLCLGAIACDSSSWEETTPVINRYERKWVKTFGGSEEDIAHDIIALPMAALHCWGIAKVLMEIY